MMEGLKVNVESVSLQIMEIKVDSPDISAFYKENLF